MFEDFSCSSLGATVVIEEVSTVACSFGQELTLFGSGTTIFVAVPIAIAASVVLAVTDQIIFNLDPNLYLVPVRFPLFTYKITIILKINLKM